MSEIKDKVVSLEILKVAYDELKEETGQLSEENTELKGEIADKATLENGVVKFWKASTEESRTDTLLYSVDISSIGGTGGLDLENLTLSVSQVGNYQRLSMSDGTTTKNVDIPITTITDEQVQNAVNNYMAANPIDETDPTVPAWAKQENKPIYTASEVGALPDTTKYLPNPKSITFTGNSDSKSYTGNSSLVIDIPSYVNIPESLKNPYSLTFTGAFNGSYDGSENVTVNIPVGSDNGTLSVGYVNALEYGLVGDGITDNLALFNQMVSENPGKTIYFGSGVYCFSGQLNIQKAYIILDNAEFKLTSNSIQTFFVKVIGYQPEGTEFPQDDMFIRGNGTINANKKANVALGIGTQKMMQISGLKITGFLQTGLLNGFDDRSGYCYELQASNLLIYNTEILDNSVAIISGADSTFRDIVTLNVKTAINVVAGGNIFSNIHAWNFDFTYANKTSVAGTRFAYITTGSSRFSDCYIDTCQYGFVLADGAKQVMITNLFWFINSETYPSGYTPVVFTPNPSVDSKFYVCNAYLPSSYGAKFSETTLDSSTFYNVVSDMRNAVNFSGVGSSSSSGISNPLTEELNFNGFFAANVGGFNFPQNSRGRNAYLGQIDRDINGDNIPVLRIQRWDAPTNSDLPVIITGMATPTEDTDAANKSYVDSLISGVETLLGGGF